MTSYKTPPQQNTSPKIVGRFWFKKTSSGNLLGEYSNNATNRAQTESADLLTPPEVPDQFSGLYKATWHEDSGDTGATLKIEPVKSGLWKLTWKRASGNEFEGEAMSNDGILIGNYWSTK